MIIYIANVCKKKVNRMQTITKLLCMFMMDKGNLIRYNQKISELINELEFLLNDVQEIMTKYPVLKTENFDDYTANTRKLIQAMRDGLRFANHSE